MITTAKVRIYSRYYGDLDMWLRTGRQDEKEFMSSADWHLIDTLIQDCIVVLRGLGSEKREADALKRLKENCED